MPDDMVVVKTCPECGKVFYGDGEPYYCLKCNVRLQKFYKPKTQPVPVQQVPQYIPRCPTCGSPRVSRIDRWESTYRRLQFFCNNCGYEW